MRDTILFGKYQLCRTIGKGQVGTVYLARHLGLGEYRAIKRVAKADSCYNAFRREVLLLKYYNGYSAREIAGFLSATPDAVTQTLHRARKKLAEILDERGETP